ncbi:MAG: pyridoxal-phosphate dependent enzyme [Chloroflexi bacterium]|nr:pyridoxal-phosphate dependent enzyme [Chloroflexota bacterium]
MPSLFNQATCLECDQELEFGLIPGKCPECGSTWLNAKYDLDSLPPNWVELISQRPTNMWRYEELLPFSNDQKIISMGEGWTPLSRAEGFERELSLLEIWIKDERQQPTGSFKDRQAASAVRAMKANGIKELVLASTGNAAAAYAAYCARAEIKLWVFLTSSVPAEKMRELALYGAEVVKITGTYDEAKQIASDFAARRGIHVDNGAKGIPNKESMKTVAFEIVEQLGWKAPDWYIQAVSGGLGPLGVLKGFEELKQVGIIDKVPKFGLVQAAGCAPMVRAWEAGLDEAEPVIPDTLITVLSTGNPGLAYKTLKHANDKYGGAMVAVTDGEAFRAMRRTARIEGFSVEPAASVAFAGLEKLANDNFIQTTELVVVNCSGHTFSAEKHALEDQYTFDLQIPVEEGAPRRPEGLSAALAQLDEQVTTIAIVDDNLQYSRMLRRLLQRRKKYRIFEAHNGPDGIDLIRQREPDLVMLDLTLPKMDGFSIIEALKRDEKTKDIPVMIISGKDLDSEQQEFLQSRAQSVWQKGNFSSDELVDYVIDVLGDDNIIPPNPEVNVSIFDANEKTVEVGGNNFDDHNRPRILVVDDNAVDARLMRRLFQTRHNFVVEEANSGEKALEILKETIPDLIILDYVLPGLNGLELLEVLRQNDKTKEIPVIIISAKDFEPSTRAELANHADSVWPKAMLDRRSLLERVENILTE